MIEKLYFAWPQRYGIVLGSHLIGISVLLLVVVTNYAVPRGDKLELKDSMLCAAVVLHLVMHHLAKKTQRRLNSYKVVHSPN